MREYLDIGPAPCEEDCAQVGSDHYYKRARSECYRFIAAIRATVGPEPEGASLVVKLVPHAFGSYFDVVVQFDDENETACAYAYRVKDQAPVTWPGGA